jgi:hypothetical protein
MTSPTRAVDEATPGDVITVSTQCSTITEDFATAVLADAEIAAAMEGIPPAARRLGDGPEASPPRHGHRRKPERLSQSCHQPKSGPGLRTLLRTRRGHPIKSFTATGLEFLFRRRGRLRLGLDRLRRRIQLLADPLQHTLRHDVLEIHWDTRTTGMSGGGRWPGCLRLRGYSPRHGLSMRAVSPKLENSHTQEIRVTCRDHNS